MNLCARALVPIAALALTLTIALPAKDKKPTLPVYVVSAQTVTVLIDPNAGTSMTSPLANKTAQDDVEKALMKWGRLRPIMETGIADLIITVRKGEGKVVKPTIGGLPTNDRPVIVQPTDTGIRLGGSRGTPPGSTQTTPRDTGPGPQVEVSPPNDEFLVYEGHVNISDLADHSPIWRLTAKDALKSPSVPAVAEFRKALEETEKQLQQAQAQKKKP